MVRNIKKVCDCLTNCGDDPDIEKGIVQGCNLYKRMVLRTVLYRRIRDIENFESFTKSQLIHLLKSIKRYM